ncbi:MAG TPA: enolase C-terminal domain-like protein [Anaerolineae bacterium]|nr:enolase C-terminal domain-like protein [Anaerolineae bacterium]
MPKIAEIHTSRFRLPMAGALSWGQASRMDSLEHVLVRIVTDTGHVGLAEAPPRPTIYGETPESIQTIIQHHLAPALIGRDIVDFEGTNRQMAAIANNHTAKGAIDICLYEALAACQGQSLLDYFNPPKRKIKVSYILGISDQATMLAEAKAVYDRGVRVFKVKVGRNFAGDLARIQELQAEFKGSQLELYADANEGLWPEQATAQLRQLADLGILYVEEPLPVELIPERASLREATILPLIADDSVFTPRDLTRELRYNTFDILNIKTARTGYTQSLQMLTAARQHGKGVMVGSQASSTLGTIRAAIFAGLDGIDYPCELSFFLKLEGEIVNRPIALAEGYLDLDTLRGITVDEARLRASQ